MLICNIFHRLVHVCSYWRFRKGQWEQVCEHCRSFPR